MPVAAGSRAGRTSSRYQFCTASSFDMIVIAANQASTSRSSRAAMPSRTIPANWLRSVRRSDQ